jgi:hypothetical protein
MLGTASNGMERRAPILTVGVVTVGLLASQASRLPAYLLVLLGCRGHAVAGWRRRRSSARLMKVARVWLGPRCQRESSLARLAACQMTRVRTTPDHLRPGAGDDKLRAWVNVIGLRHSA